MTVNVLKYWEHFEDEITKETGSLSRDRYEAWFPKTHRGKKANIRCFSLEKSENVFRLKTSYCIGVDWVEPEQTAIYIAPKLNDEAQKVDFIHMLFSSLKHPEVAKEVHELFTVKWDQPFITIEQDQDLLTPFLVAEFLGLLRTIVRKGLKRSYYSVEQNLHGRVKGKILVGKSIKHNLFQNKKLQTYCKYDEFGLNNKENRLLKKALSFVKRYLPGYARLMDHKDLQNTFNYINPAFQKVSDSFDLSELKHSRTNAFYSEYEGAIRLAKLILKRFGYNISNTEKNRIQTPPFWIDMSKLFELYVLGLLKDRFQKQVQFQYRYYGNELDYLLKSPDYQMVIDAKYKPKYIDGKDDEDIRQVSGYARLRNVYKELGKEQGDIIDCLIMYPDQKNGLINLDSVNLKEMEIPQYFDVYKLGIKLPHVD